MERGAGPSREDGGKSDEATRVALADALRAERRRRLGIFIMYAPAFFLAVLLGVLAPLLAAAGANGPPPAPPLPGWLEALLIAALAGMFASLLACPFGVAIRVVNSKRLAQIDERFEFKHLVPESPLVSGERLGAWVVRRLDACPNPLVELRIELAPPALWRILAWSYSGFLLLCIGGAIAQGGGPLGAMVGLGLFGAIYCVFFADRRARATGGAGARMELITAWHPLLPRRCSRADAGPGATIMVVWQGVIVNDAGGNSVVLGGFAPGSLGRWQAARLASLLGRCLDVPVVEPDPTFEDPPAQAAPIP